MPAQSSIPGYVARYGDALRRLQGGQQPGVAGLGTIAAGRIADPSLSPGTGALGQEAAMGVANGPGIQQGALAPPPQVAPAQMGGADAAGALNAAPAAKQGALNKPKKSFWDVVSDLDTAEKQHITKQFEDKGVDVPNAYKQAVSEGKINPQPTIDAGFVKRKADGSLDTHDMGLFLLEAGLHQMQNASQPGATALGSAGASVLGTIDARRGRAAAEAGQAESQRRFTAEEQDKAEERKVKSGETQAQRDIATQHETGADKRADADNANKLAVAKIEAVSRERASRMIAGKDRKTFTDADSGNVYWEDSGEQVMVKDKGGKEVPLNGKTSEERGDVTDKDILAASEKQRASLEGNPIAKVTIPGDPDPVRWSQATDEQKNLYLDAFKTNLKRDQKPSKKTPKAAGKNVFDQFD